MAQREQTSILGSAPLVVAVMFIAGGVVVSRLPLGSARPEPPEGLKPPMIDANMVGARLWQDPFKAAQEHDEAAHGKGEGDEPTCLSAHCVNQITDGLRCALNGRCVDRPNRPPAIQILTLMVQHTDSDEDYERRLRDRHAVHTALNAAGMEPEETRHIQYFRLSRDDGWPRAAEPLIVPFETFRRDKLYPEPEKPTRETRPKKLIVVWFPEGALGESPLASLAKLMDLFMGSERTRYLSEVLTGCWPSLRLDVIGPSRSSTLRAMLEELSLAPRVDEVWQHVTVFSPWSTASPVLLTSALPAKTAPTDSNWRTVDSVKGPADLFDLVTSRFTCADIEFVRMIGTDDLLAMQMIEELRRRRIYVVAKGPEQAGAHIALVCERDTFYGKSFALVFGAMVACFDAGGTNFDWGRYARNLNGSERRDPPPLPENVHTYCYTNGIDGRLPGETWGEKAGESKEGRPAEPVWMIRRGLEMPTGRGRLDYGRRLANELRQHYLRHEGHELQAIGVVGSDVYDKMTLLRALCEEFGEVALFTTDLDARLLYHKQLNWTRNVIVASNYGLEVNGEYQRRLCERGHDDSGSYAEETTPPRFAPFRDNYQTALFLACRTALGLQARVGKARVPFRTLDQEILAKALSHPRLFEIGRGQAVDLSVTSQAPDEPEVNIHPVHAQCRGLLMVLRRHVWLLLSLVIAATLLWPVLRVIVPLVSRLEHREYRELPTWHSSLRRYRYVMLLAGVAWVIMACAIVTDHYDKGGEPFSLTTGVSAWVGILFFLLAMLLGILFIGCSMQTVRANEKAIEAEFGLPGRDEPDKRLMKRAQAYTHETYERTEDFLRRCYQDKGWKWARGSLGNEVNAVWLWQTHILGWRLSDRLFWPVVWFGAFSLFQSALVKAFGRPHAPCRGDACYRMYACIGLVCFISFLALLILIANETRRRLRVINPIINKHTVWQTSAFDDRKQSDISDWLDVRFVARITEGAGKLVYFPSVILLLLIAARLPYFDNWGFPPLLYMIYAIPAAYILGHMAILQLAARRARATALYHLRQKLEAIALGRRRQPVRRERIEGMITEVEALREGAFRPFAENPIVHALLIPSGGAGLLAMLTFLLPS